MPLNSAALEKIRANDEPFHELFDCQWSITDFETSVMFDPDSDPETWKVVGLCGGAVDVPVSEYSKVNILGCSFRIYPDCKVTDAGTGSMAARPPKFALLSLQARCIPARQDHTSFISRKWLNSAIADSSEGD